MECERKKKAVNKHTHTHIFSYERIQMECERKKEVVRAYIHIYEPCVRIDSYGG